MAHRRMIWSAGTNLPGYDYPVYDCTTAQFDGRDPIGWTTEPLTDGRVFSDHITEGWGWWEAAVRLAT